MLKHAGERPRQHRQGLCSLSRALSPDDALLPAVKTAFTCSFCSKKAKKIEEKEKERIRPRCCAVRPHFTPKRSSCRDSFRTSSREQLFGSEAKSWRCNASAAHYIPALRGEQLLHMIACQCVLARFSYTRSRLASLARFLFVSQSDVRRTWPTEWELKGNVTFRSDVRPSMMSHTRNLCSAFNPSKCTHSSEHTHTHTHTHTVNSHPEQWAANAAAPGEQLGVRCLAQGSHLSPHDNSCRTWDSNPRPSGYKSDSLSIRPRLPQVIK